MSDTPSDEDRLKAAGYWPDKGTQGHFWPSFWWLPDGSYKVSKEEALRRLDAEKEKP